MTPNPPWYGIVTALVFLSVIALMDIGNASVSEEFHPGALRQRIIRWAIIGLAAIVLLVGKARRRAR